MSLPAMPLPTMTSETSKTEAAVPCGIYREVDGFYYFDPLPGQGCYSAHNLRWLADVLDKMNEPWAAGVAAAVAAKPVQSPPCPEQGLPVGGFAPAARDQSPGGRTT